MGGGLHGGWERGALARKDTMNRKRPGCLQLRANPVLEHGRVKRPNAGDASDPLLERSWRPWQIEMHNNACALTIYAFAEHIGGHDE